MMKRHDDVVVVVKVIKYDGCINDSSAEFM